MILIERRVVKLFQAKRVIVWQICRTNFTITKATKFTEPAELPPLDLLCAHDIVEAANSATTTWSNKANGASKVIQNYLWLNSLVNPNTRANQIFTVYDAGFCSFVLFQSSNEINLYFENGMFYCSGNTKLYAC